MSSCLMAHQHNTGYSVPLMVECWNDARVENTGVEKAGADRRGGKCRSKPYERQPEIILRQP